MEQVLGESSIPHDLEYMRNDKICVEDNHRYASYQFPSHNMPRPSILNGAIDTTDGSNHSVSRIAAATESAAQLGRGNPFLSITDIIINSTIWSTDASPSLSTEPRWIARSTID